MKLPEPRIDHGALFPNIEQELGAHLHLFSGRVLNAGAGDRDIRHLVEGEVVNQDIDAGLHNANIDVLGPLHEIPFPADHFDAIICNAVLEHVENPHEVLEEFRRVLRPGGTLYLCVPFMQPEHLDPGDYQRYTLPGLNVLVETHGFAVAQAEGLHSVYTTLAWIGMEWLQAIGGIRGWALRWVLIPLLHRLPSRGRHVHSLASAYRVIATLDR